MPELPEVEMIRRVLEPQIKGLTITTVTVNRPEVIGHPAEEEFCQVLMGQTICAMTRRGKFLSVLLDSALVCYVTPGAPFCRTELPFSLLNYSETRQNYMVLINL